MEQPLLA